MQGLSWSRAAKIITAILFGAAFLAAAMSIFAMFNALGVVFGTPRMPVQWRLGLASTALLSLASVDLLAMGKSTYCPLGWRRQTPKILMRRHSMAFVAAVWGFDTGLAVTTFRVAAVTWGALLLAGLGLSPWWAGLGYGLGFSLPFMILLWRHRVGRSSRDNGPADPGLESLLQKRSAIQGLSAAVLLTSGGILIGSLMA